MDSTTLDPIANATDVKSGLADKAVRTFLKLIRDNYSAKSQVDAKNRTLRDMVESGFEVHDPSGTRIINCKKLYQAFWKTMQRVRLLDFVLNASQRPEWIEKIVTDGISTVLRKSGYVSMFADKGGLFQNGFGYGYAFGWFGTREGKGIPFKFQPLAGENVYLDSRATAMRSGSKPVKRALVITPMTWSEFVSLYPEWENKVQCGRIPRDFTSNELDQDEEQALKEEEIIEVGYGYDTITKSFIQFAGKQCVVMERKIAKEYPYSWRNRDTGEEEAYIPIIHFSCLPSFKGFYDHGIFDSIYDLSVLYSRILNMQSSYTIEGVDPVRWLSVPKGQASKVFAKFDLARRMKAEGQTPVVAIEYDPKNPGASQVSAQALQVQSLINEAQILFDRIDLEIKRFGISLDEPEAGNVTATQILADEENANRFVKQVMEMNATEFEFILNVVIDLFPKLIKETNKIPVQMKTIVQVGEMGETFEIRADGVTLGMISKEIKHHEYFVDINRGSGADQSKLHDARMMKILGITPPGTPAYFDLISKISRNNGVDQPAQAFGGGQGQLIPQEGAQAEVPQTTAPMTFNPRQSEQQAVF